MDDEVNVKFGAQLEGALAGINQLKSNLETISGSVQGVIGTFKDLGEAAIAAFAVEKLEHYIASMTELATTVERGTAISGLGADEFQELGFAIKLAGGSADALQPMMTRLENNMERARDAAGPARKAFADLGVSLHDLQNDSPHELLLKLADGFHNLKDPIEAARDAMLTGSRTMAQMLPLLKQGSAAVKDFEDQLKATGSELTGNQITAFVKTHEALVIMEASFEGLGIAIFDKLEPAIDDILAAFTVLAQSLTWIINKFHELGYVLGYDVVVGAARLLNAIQDLGAEVELVTDTAMIRWKEVGAVMTAVATGNFSLISEITQEADDEIAAAAKKATAAIIDQDKSFQNLKHAADQALGALLKVQEAEKGQGGGGHESGKPDAGALDDITTREAIAKANLATQVAILQQEQVYHQITKQQEVEQEKEAVDAAHAIDVDALNDKIALYAKDPEEKAKILNQLEVLEAQHTAKIAQLDVKLATANRNAAQETYNSWKQVLSPIENAFDGVLTGVLNGTQTLTQGMANMFENMAVSVVESIAKIVAEWILFEIVTYGEGTWSDFVAIQGGGSGGGGPLGFIGGLFGFAEGTDYVPRTGLALIHEGEMVIPPAQSAAIRSGQGDLGGGTSSVNITIQAIDTQTGAQFLRNNASTIAATIAGQMRNQNSQIRRAMGGS